MGKAKTWEEYKAECETIAKDGIKVLDFVEPWKGCKTKLVCSCLQHGIWSSTEIKSFISYNVSCPICAKVPKSRLSSWEMEKPNLIKIAKNRSLELLGFISPWLGAKTKLILSCLEHGRYETTSLDNFKHGRGCPKCRTKKTKERSTIPDEQHVEDFTKTGVFPFGVKFYRSNKLLCGEKYKRSWEYFCPVCYNDEYGRAGVCDGIFTSTRSSLKRGMLACRCSPNYKYTKEQWEFKIRKECLKRKGKFLGWSGKGYGESHKFKYSCEIHGEQNLNVKSFMRGSGCPQCAGHCHQQCYINVVHDGDLPVSIKFGIAKDAERRLNRQNSRNLFQMQTLMVYSFGSVMTCKSAEFACKKELGKSWLTKKELRDGYTETTSIQNLDKIIEIYERFGGIRL